MHRVKVRVGRGHGVESVMDRDDAADYGSFHARGASSRVEYFTADA